MKLATLIGSLLLLGCLSGCYKKNENSAISLQEIEQEVKDKRVKLTVVPLLDHSSHQLPWNLSQELTQILFQRLQSSQKFSLVPLEVAKKCCEKLHNHQDPFTPFPEKATWIKEQFKGSQFVAFVQLLEHESPLDQKAAHILMSAQVRVFDLREKYPQVILQEVVKEKTPLPRQFCPPQFHQVEWADERFFISPLGVQHDQFMRQIGAQIEEYISMHIDP